MSSENITFIGDIPIGFHNAGSKARSDADALLYQRYGEPFVVRRAREFTSFLQKVGYVLNPSIERDLLKLRFAHGKTAVLQHPCGGNFILMACLDSFLAHNKPILLVHDYESLRGYIDADRELAIFNAAEVLISHNECMTAEMRSRGVKAPCVELELFDYLLPGAAPRQDYELTGRVVFAGNLEKSTWLKVPGFADLGVGFQLYGDGYSKEAMGGAHVVYKGSFSPEKIPYQLAGGSFGLIWDGDSLDTCAGTMGRYMRYNNPHKLSLYIAAGLPVAVWREAAVARFVQTYNIGIVVDSLWELKDAIARVTQDEYSAMLASVATLQARVTSGYYLNRALDECEKILLA